MTHPLQQWAIDNNVSPAALTQLRGLLMHDQTDPGPNGSSEAIVQAQVRAEAARRGWRLWRNNSGGDPASGLRWGLGNDNAKINKLIKSSDLIGLKPDGQFVALEIKEQGWIYRDTAHERAQAAFLAIVNACGGDGRFISDVRML